MTKPSRASSYSKSDDRAPAVRGAAHRAPSRISDVPKSSSSPQAGGKAPPRSLPSVRALYVGRGDRKKTGFWWHALCDELKHKNAARPERGCGGTIFQRASYLGLLVPFAA